MSGHSKWATIKRKKAATDSKRGKAFNKVLKEIQVAARLGGGHISGNARLKTAVQAAKAISVPADNIERAIKRGTGDLEGVSYEEINYEGYGPGGVALLIKALTDNRNRTVSDVRSTLTRWNGTLGGTNSVAYQFHERGVIMIPKSAAQEDELFTVALESGASDIKDLGECWEVISEVADFDRLRTALEKIGNDFQAEQRLIPDTLVRVSGKEAEQLIKLLASLEELDDVQNVYANFEMDDRELEVLSAE